MNSIPYQPRFLKMASFQPYSSFHDYSSEHSRWVEGPRYTAQDDQAAYFSSTGGSPDCFNTPEASTYPYTPSGSGQGEAMLGGSYHHLEYPMNSQQTSQEPSVNHEIIDSATFQARTYGSDGTQDVDGFQSRDVDIGEADREFLFNPCRNIA